MSWKTSIVTNAGVDMLNESLAGHTLTIVGAVGGAGVMTEEELAAAATVADLKQTFTLLGMDSIENGKKVKIQITNEMVEESYVLHQIGVMAKLEFEEAASLLFVLQDERGVEIPSKADNPGFLFEVYVGISISNNANITLLVNNNAVASVSFVEDYVNASIRELKSTMTKSLMEEIEIPADGWVRDEDAEDAEEYAVFVDVPAQSTSSMFAKVAIHRDALKTARNAGLCPSVMTLDGAIRFWARTVPADDIAATVELTSAGGMVDGTGPGGGTYEMPIAGRDRVGGIKVGENLDIADDGTLSATCADAPEVEEMLDEVFGPVG